MPRKISFPTLAEFHSGLAEVWTRRWLNRRATKAVPVDEYERDRGFVELRDFKGHFDEPLSREDVHFLANHFCLPTNQRTPGDIVRFEALVNSDCAEATCLLLWLHRQRSDVGIESLVDGAIETIVATAGDATAAEITWSAKEVEALLEELNGKRAGGWSSVVEESLRKYRRTATKAKKVSVKR